MLEHLRGGGQSVLDLEWPSFPRTKIMSHVSLKQVTAERAAPPKPQPNSLVLG